MHTLHDHALLLHQHTHACGAPESSQSSQTLTLVSPLYKDVAHTLGLQLMSSLRLADMPTHTLIQNADYMNVKLQDGVYHLMQPASPETSKENHQEASSMSVNSFDRYTTELLDKEWSPQGASGMLTSTVSIALMEPGLSKSVTLTQLSAQKQQKLVATIGESPGRRLCIDYRSLNIFLLPVTKAHSKAKQVLTLIHLPKIDDIYAQLAGSKTYSTLDLRNSYYHIALSKESKKKLSFGTPMGKFEF